MRESDIGFGEDVHGGITTRRRHRKMNGSTRLAGLRVIPGGADSGPIVMIWLFLVVLSLQETSGNRPNYDHYIPQQESGLSADSSAKK